jgi:hypothetical protein
MRAAVLVFVVLAACTGLRRDTANPDASPPPDSGAHDTGTDAEPMDAGTDAAADAGHDAGATDAGPTCTCSGVSACCDGCDVAPLTTVCASVDGPESCYPATYVVPGLYGYDTAVTRCGASGSCDGAQSVDEHRWSCPAGDYCRKSGGQAICDH